jgi:RNA-binding protein
MTSKQRSYLKGLAMSKQAIFQLGKGDIDENFINQIDTALEARELIKITTLPSHLEGPHAAAEALAEACGAEVVQVIGSKIVLYRESRENKKIVLPS